MKRNILIFIVACAFFIVNAIGQESRNGRGGAFNDPFLDGLVGEWNIKRSIRGQTLDSRLTAAWVLNHQFLELRMNDRKEPSDYSALVYIGYSDVKKSYVLHWIDTFGGAASETLGYGKRDGDKIVFELAYPEGAFRNTFTHDTKANAWTFRMEGSDGKGGWNFFAEDRLTREKALGQALPLGSAIPPVSVSAITLLVEDYDAAIKWYTGVLGFDVKDNKDGRPGKRWVMMSSKQDPKLRIFLHKPGDGYMPVDKELKSDRIGKETFWILKTADFDTMLAHLKNKGVTFRSEAYDLQSGGKEIVFEDLYGNLWVLQ